MTEENADNTQQPTEFPKFKKEPFRRTNLGESSSDIMNIRLNAQERQMLTDAKMLMHIEADGTTFKLLAQIGWCVLQNTFPPEVLKYVSSARRVRPGVR